MPTYLSNSPADAASRAEFVRDRLPQGGLFAGQTWRIAPEAFAIDPKLADELERLGPMLAEFYRACNLLYRHSVSGKWPAWVARYLDLGKPPELIAAARNGRFKAELPRVIRPDVLITEGGMVITELDSVPGGIGLTGWLNETYGALERWSVEASSRMLDGFGGIFSLHGGTGVPACVRIIVSEESAGYRPEMNWLAQQLRTRGRDIEVVDLHSAEVAKLAGSQVYRFFELFDMANEPNAQKILDAAGRGELEVTPPFKPWLEEKMLFAFLWHSQLRDFWRMELGEKTLAALQKVIPYTWIVDPTPLPPHAVIPELDIHDWREMAKFSQKQRELVLKVSGFSPQAWGSRGVWVGHDLSAAEWGAAIEEALKNFEHRPCILQRYHKSAIHPVRYYDFETKELKAMQGRARLCPYYFVSTEDQRSQAASTNVRLGGILATLCPSDKKVIHGMTDAIMVPCKTSDHNIKTS